MALLKSEVTDLIREGLSPHVCASIIPKDSSLKELGQVTSVAKPPDLAVQSEGCENGD
jgi:hypothetical protein